MRSRGAIQRGVVLLALTLLAGCSTPQPARTPVDDTAITASIKAKLAADGDLNPFDIDVTTNHGVVTLQGRVKNEEAKVKAERYASAANGVVRIVNLVKVGDIR
jgi:osmotically-inducible protein OsmY